MSMQFIFSALVAIHILLVFAIGIWLLAQGRDEVKRIPKGFTSLTLATMVLSLAMMQVNLMQHNDDTSVTLLSPYKYIVKSAVFAVVIWIAVTNNRKVSMSKGKWQAMIGLMALDLIITGVWM